ncbi:hypothetical protein SUDANB145_00014 [Streptomyces sp. enrichment culture]
MTAWLALGTYRCQAIPEAAAHAATSGVWWIGTAPNHTAGSAQTLLAPVLAVHPFLRASTKAGYFTAAAAEAGGWGRPVQAEERAGIGSRRPRADASSPSCGAKTEVRCTMSGW